MRAVARELRDLGDKRLKREFTKAITKTIEPLKNELAQSALATLPRRGGLNRRVASSTKYRVSRRANGSVSLIGRSNDLRALRKLDWPGRVRHPVFQKQGVDRRRVPWVEQKVTPNWFTRPTEAKRPALQSAMIRAADEMAARINQMRN
jgi:hypothetical protein